jgi:hypothetical protein
LIRGPAIHGLRNLRINHRFLKTKTARWVNVVLANIKRSLSGVYHSIQQKKYARRYLAEAKWHLNWRLGPTRCSRG